MIYAAVPGMALLLGGLLVVGVKLTRNIQALVQNLAAGIILAAVADQLVPLMKNDKGSQAEVVIGMCAGFSVALALMYTVDRYCGHHDEAGAGEGEERQSLVRGGSGYNPESPTDLRRLSYQRTPSTTRDSAARGYVLPTATAGKGGAAGVEDKWSALPWALIVGVTVNTCVDGFLIGLTYPASSRAALIVAFATTVEHLFLGVTYLVTLRDCTTWRKYVPVMIGPAVMMMGAGLLGAIFSSLSEESPAVFVGLMTFGTTALLFLITHELLMEAYDNQDGKQLWWVTIWIFLGFFVVLVVEHLLPTSTH